MANSDGGDFRRCAAREVFEETIGIEKLLCLRRQLHDRLGCAPEHQMHAPFLFRWVTYLVLLKRVPPLDLWPNPSDPACEFDRWGWFSPLRLPSPLHRFMNGTIHYFAPQLAGLGGQR
jgi:hypothetical protein